MGKLFVVGTPIGNLEDLSFRAQRILSEVDVIAAEDTRRTKILLSRYGVKTLLVSYHKFNVRAKTSYIIELLSRGKSVALVSDAGMPGISDPGHELVNEAVKCGFEVVPVPGPSAVTTALAVSGMPADRFCFGGFIPGKAGDRQKLFKKAAKEVDTTVFFEAPHRLIESLKIMREIFGDRSISVSRELTKKFEEVVRGRISEVISYFSKKEPRGEFAIVVEGRAEEKKDLAEAEKLARQMVDAGVSKKDAARIASEVFDAPKNIIYKAILK